MPALALPSPQERVKTNVYVDGFNLYYGWLHGSAHKWLDPVKLAQGVFPPPRNVIHRVRYFTAQVKPRPQDPSQHTRQLTYLRALRTLPEVCVHYGEFLASTPRMPLAEPGPGGQRFVRVLKSEEKGSDVNLASYLLLDAFDDDFEAAIVVTNDSDLATPIHLVRQRFKKPVIVLHPCRPANPQLPPRHEDQPAPPSIQLKKVASKSVLLLERHLAAAQFPAQLADAVGLFTKPLVW
jgi:hypothetical protein